jgi:FtsH-binding integral membrane protein
MNGMEVETIQQMLAIVTLLLGALLIGIIFNAYRIVRQPTLLLFIYGLFTLVVGITFADIVSVFTPDGFIIAWSAVFSHIVVILGLCVMAYGIMRG